MRRALLTAAFVAAVAAGCGGASLNGIAQKYAAQLGDPHPSRIRIETNQLVGFQGGRQDMIELWGHFTCKNGCGLYPSCGPVVSAKQRRSRNFCVFRGTWAKIDLATGSHELRGVELGSSRDPATLSQARRIRPLFAAFPDTGDVRNPCRLTPQTPGTCSTSLSGDGAFFHVRWTYEGHTYRGGWVVTLGSPPSIRVTGAVPTQLFVLRAIAAAKATNPDAFAPFPRSPSEHPCSFTGGGSARAWGMCTTSIARGPARSHRVAFGFRWWNRRPNGKTEGVPHHLKYVVTVDRRNRVTGTQLHHTVPSPPFVWH